MRNVAMALVAGLVASLGAPTALAWNESGHRVIAAYAALALAPETQATVVRLLEAHPRYVEDLAAYEPRRLKGLTEAQWLLGQAAQWPDHARGFDNAPRGAREELMRAYHRGNWHYINLPVYMTAADEALDIKDPTQPLDEGTGQTPADVLQALRFIELSLTDPLVADTDKGLWLAWALHVIADVHQPLHTSAMFSRDRWPRGDRGGNEIKIAGSGRWGRPDSLHYFWDSAISNRIEPREIKKLVTVLEQLSLPALKNNEVDPVEWIHEGHNLARHAVYGPLRDQLKRSPFVTITSDYTRAAHATSLTQAALAARRTALWLTAALGPERDPIQVRAGQE